MSCETGKELMQQIINRTINAQGSWPKHIAHSCCKCEKCTCGKHKCQIKSPHLELTPANSSYNQFFQRRRPISQGHLKKEVIRSYEPRQLVSKSQYKSQYVDKIKEAPKPKMEIHQDNITTGGPTFATTTYNTCYASVQGSPACQIKNPETLGLTPGAKIQSSSAYRDAYKWQTPGKKEKPIKHSDNLKTQISFFTSKSRYSTDFHQFKGYKRDKSNFAPNRTYESKKGLKTETSYNDHYSAKNQERCPAESCC